MSVTVIYGTEARQIKGGASPGQFFERTFDSVEQAKSAPIPDTAVSAVILVEGGRHVYSRTLGWEYQANSEFEKAVQQYADEQRKSERAVDWNERKGWWQEKVTELLTQIEEWLSPLIQSGAVVFSRSKTSLTEEQLGSYDIDMGAINLGRTKLSLKPVGSVIIGGFGRVDVDGPKGNVMLILASPEADLPDAQRRENAMWFISHPKSRRELRPLTKQSFEQLFADVFGITG